MEAIERALIDMPPSAGGFHSRVVVGPRQGKDAETGSKPLFGMRASGHDLLEKRGGRRADFFGGGDESARRPGRMAPVGARHVFGKRRMAAPVRGAQMIGDALAFEEYLGRFVGDAHVDRFADQSERRGIPMAVDLDMVIGGNATALPNGEGVRLLPQLLQGRPVIAAKSSARLALKPFIRRALSSARLKKRRLRSLATIHRSAIRTDCSTLALSRGL